MFAMCLKQGVVISRNRLSSLFLSEGIFSFLLLKEFTFMDLFSFLECLLIVCLLKEKEDSPCNDRVKVSLGSQMDDEALKDEVLSMIILMIFPH